MASSGSYARPPRGVSFLAVNGNMHHYLGPARPAPGAQPKFAQLYIIDDEYQQLQARLQAMHVAGMEDLDEGVLRDLQAMLQEHKGF